MLTESNDTRSKILEAAVSVFAQKGYHETRVDDIVAESKKSKGSIYFYFPSKQDIFLGLIDSFSHLIEKNLTNAIDSNEHGVFQLRTALRDTLHLFGKYKTLAKIVLVQSVGLGEEFEKRHRAINDRLAEIIEKRLIIAAKEGSIPEINPSIIARAWIGALNEIVIHWIYSEETDMEDIIPTVEIFLLNSIGLSSSRLLKTNNFVRSGENHKNE